MLKLAGRRPAMQLAHIRGPRQTTCSNLKQLHAILARTNASMCFGVCAKLGTMLLIMRPAAVFFQLLYWSSCWCIVFCQLLYGFWGERQKLPKSEDAVIVLAAPWTQVPRDQGLVRTELAVGIAVRWFNGCAPRNWELPCNETSPQIN